MWEASEYPDRQEDFLSETDDAPSLAGDRSRMARRYDELLSQTDGAWARYWYGEVAKSTSFQHYKPREKIVPVRLHELHEQCREHYERLYECRLH